jgi:uncharacterized iron-regulated protein
MNPNKIPIPSGVALALACAISAAAQEQPAHPPLAPACLAPAAWYALDGAKPRAIPGPELLGEIARRDVVLLGEQHDNADDHQWQIETLAALHLLRPKMVIGFEAFPRRAQPVLDKWIAGELTVTQFLEQTEWDKVWNYPSGFYLPLFQFARINRVPMVALNVERTLPEVITKKGWDAVPADQKEGVSRPAPPSAAYRDFLFDVFKTHPHVAGRKTGAADKDDKTFRFFVESQTAWDRAMAEALAPRVEKEPGEQRALVVGIMGSGHVRRGFGVPHQLRDLGVANIGTLLPVAAKQDCSEIKAGLADAIFALPGMPAEKTPPPRLGVQIEAVNGGVRLLVVHAGSLAEQTGLRSGDIIESIAGAPVKKMSSVIAAVRAQPAGTWLPLQIRRGTGTLEFVVKFPPQK